MLATGATFWKDPDGVAYVTIPRGGRTERYRVRSAAFRSVVRAIYAEACPRITDDGEARPGSIADKAMTEALPSLEAMVLRPGTETRVPGLRSILADDGRTLWVDLGRDDWALVRVTRDGWEIVPGADVPLVRADAVRALPIPSRNDAAGALAELQRLLNLRPDQRDEFCLLVSWLVACLWPCGPYPILAIDGEQGSGKSTASRMLRKLVDPNKSPLRAPPKTEADLIVAAAAGRIVAIDNVSHLDPDMADTLCRLSTGAGLSRRRLYTDDDEHLVEVCRPVLLNGINSVLSRGDIADRALVIGLPRIPDERRVQEADLQRDFDKAAPGILAALLNALSEALHYDTGLERLALPRMADFAALACRASRGLGWGPEAVLGAMERNRHAAVEAVVDSDPMSDALRDVLKREGVEGLDGEGEWRGTASALLPLLTAAVSDDVRRERSWPKDATRLSGRLRRLAPALHRIGLEVTLPETGGRAGREIVIRQRSERSQRSTQSGTRGNGNAEYGASVPAAFPKRE